MNLGRWVSIPKPQRRPATIKDVKPLFNTFQRVRKLEGLKKKFTNVEVWYAVPIPRSPDEWTLVVEVAETKAGFEVTAVSLGTTDKAKAVRRAWGWGLKDEDGNVVWPPEREDDESDDIDDDPYVAYMPEPEY